MTECNQSQFEFAPHFSRSVVAGFDGGTITSDGGALLLRETDRLVYRRSRRATQCVVPDLDVTDLPLHGRQQRR